MVRTISKNRGPQFHATGGFQVWWSLGEVYNEDLQGGDRGWVGRWGGGPLIFFGFFFGRKEMQKSTE